MRCNRRDFLKAGIAFSGATAIPSAVYPENVLAPQPGSWRTFRVTTKLDIRQPSVQQRPGFPLPSVKLEKHWFDHINGIPTVARKNSKEHDTAPKYCMFSGVTVKIRQQLR